MKYYFMPVSSSVLHSIRLLRACSATILFHFLARMPRCVNFKHVAGVSLQYLYTVGNERLENVEYFGRLGYTSGTTGESG